MTAQLVTFKAPRAAEIPQEQASERQIPAPQLPGTYRTSDLDTESFVCCHQKGTANPAIVIASGAFAITTEFSK